MEEVFYYAMTDYRGQILQINSGPYRYIPCEPDVMDDTHYVDEEGVIQPKIPIALDYIVDGLSITFNGLPDGLHVSVNGSSGVTDDEPLVAEFDIPGSYTFYFTGLAKYKDHTEVITLGDA
ncbi:hypothetical protein [Vreelandella venusta]|uniref:hypothetical protein n=1 Tax=Vreelandella venusta TaxID=44935 RepID=UPI00116BC324|nr:hypothetical protein [Halomonas venusta]GEK52330.1 hypothetical protein HVE01_30510 [Halomonas venusta]